MGLYNDEFSYEEDNKPSFSEHVQRIFLRDTLPVWVPGKDIEISKDEIIYTAKKDITPEGLVENENWDFDSVDKPKYIKPDNKFKEIEFIIREDLIHITKVKIS